MTTEIQLTLNPNKEKIALYLPFFQVIEREVKIKMTAWEKINESEYKFLENLFKSRGVKVKLDDVAYIYNYLKFIFKVSKSDFNNENALMDESLKELWPFFQMMERKEKLKRISIQTEDNKTVKFISERSLALFYEIFRYSIKELSGMRKAKKYLLQLKKQGHLNDILKRRSGNKIDYTKTVLKQSVTMFKNYLEKETVTDGNKPISKHTIIGEILARSEEHTSELQSH